MSIDLPPPPTNQTSGARGLAVIALCIFAALSLAPSYFSPLNAFVPEPYFLRSRLAADALLFQAGTFALYVVLCFLAAWKNKKGLAVLLIAAAPALALLTFVRLLSGGGVSGGI